MSIQRGGVRRALVRAATMGLMACGGEDGQLPNDLVDVSADSTEDSGSDAGADVSNTDARSDVYAEPDSTIEPCDAMCSENSLALIIGCLEPDLDREGCLEICREELREREAECLGTAVSCGGIEECFEGGDVCEIEGFMMPESAADLTLQDVPRESPLAEFFSKYVTVFGVYLMAAEGADMEKVLHAARIMAEYLDNDEDGAADDPDVVESMNALSAALILFESSDDLENSGLFESALGGCIWGQDLSTSETAQPGAFDIALEEVLHLIQTAGYSQIYPDAFHTRNGLLADAMDTARGGHFEELPESYPDEAWYHYDDPTCDYQCMASEYFYWGLTSLLGGQSTSENPSRCEEIEREWELCTPEEFESGDAALFRLLTDPQYLLPTTLPDGEYAAP